MTGIKKQLALWTAAAVLLTAVPAVSVRADEGGIGYSVGHSAPAMPRLFALPNAVNTGNFTLTRDDGKKLDSTDCSFDDTDGILTIGGSGPYTVSNEYSTNHKIVVDSSCTLTLDGVIISVRSSSLTGGTRFPALRITAAAGDVTIKLKGINSLIGEDGCAGLQKEGTGTLTITSATGNGSLDGSLKVMGHPGGAGIGGARGENASNIIINGGTITATGAAGIIAGIGNVNGGAGIGGGEGGNGSNIIINHGDVTANGDGGGAGIGGGEGGDGSGITISGGDVTASGWKRGDKGVAVGGGEGGTASNNSIAPQPGFWVNAWRGDNPSSNSQFLTNKTVATDISTLSDKYLQAVFSPVSAVVPTPPAVPAPPSPRRSSGEPDAAPSVELLEGGGAVYSGAGTLSFRFDAPLSTLGPVYVSGSRLREGDDFTATHGSTVITLSERFLHGLAPGRYILAVQFDGGPAGAVFSVEDATEPDVPDSPAPSESAGSKPNPGTGGFVRNVQPTP